MWDKHEVASLEDRMERCWLIGLVNGRKAVGDLMWSHLIITWNDAFPRAFCVLSRPSLHRGPVNDGNILYTYHDYTRLLPSSREGAYYGSKL